MSDLAHLAPEQRQEAEELLAELAAAYEANPLLKYTPHPGQAKYLAITTQIGAVFAGNRFGKTAGGLIWDLIQCCDRDAIPDHLQQYKRWDVKDHGRIKGRIVAPKFNENIEQVIFPELQKWVPKGQLIGGGWDAAFSKQKRVLNFANGSTIQFLTFDQDRDAHAGAGLHFVHFDEEPEGEKGKGLFIENTTRLADTNGDFRLTMTPLFGMSWAHKRIWKRRNTDPDVTAIQGDSYENPHINRERLRKDAELFTKEERQALREGKFVHFAGQFFPEFSESHVVKPPKAADLKDQSIVVGIDPGLNHTGVVWVAFDNDNCAVVFAELTPEQAVPEDIAPRILAVNKIWGIDPDYYVIDPSARNRATVNAEAVENAYLRAGVPTIHGQNDRAAGILEVKRRLQHEGLFVSETCANLAEEFSNYRKDPNSSDEFAAVKEGDHSLDALRYVLMERAWTVAGDDSQPDPEPWQPDRPVSADWLEATRPGNKSHPLGALV